MRGLMAISTAEFELLEQRISELIESCRMLKNENSELKQAIADAQAERSKLLDNNSEVRKHIQQAVTTLQGLTYSD